MTTVSHRSSVLDENDSAIGLFTALANPERVDVTKPKRLPRSFSGLRFPIKNEGSMLNEEVNSGQRPPLSARSAGSRSTHSSQSAPTTKQESVFDQLTRQHMESVHSNHSSPMKESPYTHTLHTLQEEDDVYTNPVQCDRFFQEFDEDVFHPETAAHIAQRHASPEPTFEFNHDTTMPVETPLVDREQRNEEEILEKQSVLLELERLEKQHGVTLTKRYTMQDNLADMQFEIRRHLSNADEANMVKFMSDGMKLMCTGVELANSRFGPFLELDGWASSVTGDMGRYNSAFSKLYRKYWRRSTMSPEMELAFALIGSIAMHHFQRKAQGIMFGNNDTNPTNNTSHQGPTSMPFQSKVSQPSSSPAMNSHTQASEQHTSVALQPSEDTDEDMPPGTPETVMSSATIPESVPISARKRLVFP